jgi:hypothetical protein
VIAAVVLPGLVLRETGVLRISRKELSGLTSIARNELERRQRIARSAGIAAPYAGALFFVLGGALLIYGAPRLKQKEDADEERFSVELDKLRSEIKPQSRSEHEERLKEDVEEELAEKMAQQATRAGEEPQFSPPSSVSPMRDVRQLMQKAAEVEERVLIQLTQIAPPRYELQANVKISGNLLMDGLLVSKAEQLPDIVVEIKLVGSSFRKNLRNRISEAIAQMSRYRARVQRATVGWLIIVVDGELGSTDRDLAMQRAAEYDVDIRISVISIDDLPGLSLPF